MTLCCRLRYAYVLTSIILRYNDRKMDNILDAFKVKHFLLMISAKLRGFKLPQNIKYVV